MIRLKLPDTIGKLFSLTVCHAPSNPSSTFDLNNDQQLDTSLAPAYFFKWGELSSLARDLATHFDKMTLHSWQIKECYHERLDGLGAFLRSASEPSRGDTSGLLDTLASLFINPRSGMAFKRIFEVKHGIQQPILCPRDDAQPNLNRWASKFPSALFFQSALLNSHYRAHLDELVATTRKAFSDIDSSDRTLVLSARDRLVGAHPGEQLQALAIINEAKRHPNLGLTLTLDGPTTAVFVGWLAHEWRRAPGLKSLYILFGGS